MDLINESKRAACMKFITDAATAENEEDVQNFLKIFNPSDRKTSGQDFVDAIGYNPINYFDIQDVMNILNDVMDSFSTDGVKILVKHKDDILTRTMDIYDSRRDQHLKDALATALSDYLESDDLKTAYKLLVGDQRAVDALADDPDDEDDDDIAITTDSDDDIIMDDDDDMLDLVEDDDE